MFASLHMANATPEMGYAKYYATICHQRDGVKRCGLFDATNVCEEYKHGRFDYDLRAGNAFMATNWVEEGLMEVLLYTPLCRASRSSYDTRPIVPWYNVTCFSELPKVKWGEYFETYEYGSHTRVILLDGGQSNSFQRSRGLVEPDCLYGFSLPYIGRVLATTLHCNLWNGTWSSLYDTGGSRRASGEVRFPHRSNVTFIGGEEIYSFYKGVVDRALDGVRFPHQFDFTFCGDTGTSSFRAGIARHALDGVPFPHRLNFMFHGVTRTSSHSSSDKHRVLDGGRFHRRLNLILLGGEVIYSFRKTVGNRALDGVHFPHHLVFMFHGREESSSSHAGIVHHPLDGVLFPRHLNSIFHGDVETSSFMGKPDEAFLALMSETEFEIVETVANMGSDRRLSKGLDDHTTSVKEAGFLDDVAVEVATGGDFAQVTSKDESLVSDGVTSLRPFFPFGGLQLWCPSTACKPALIEGVKGMTFIAISNPRGGGGGGFDFPLYT